MLWEQITVFQGIFWGNFGAFKDGDWILKEIMGCRAKNCFSLLFFISETAIVYNKAVVIHSRLIKRISKECSSRLIPEDSLNLCFEYTHVS